MQLSKRLQTVAHLVHTGGVVADIGCDHGFTIIYLVMNQLASAGIAMDVADGPLMRAKEHIHQYELDNRIALRKSDGLQQLVEGEADTILISGIGGALMERILREFPHVTQSAKELVLSPQSEIYKVRQALHDLGFVSHRKRWYLSRVNIIRSYGVRGAVSITSRRKNIYMEGT